MHRCNVSKARHVICATQHRYVARASETALASPRYILLFGCDTRVTHCLPSATVAPPFTISSLGKPVIIPVPKYRQSLDIFSFRKPPTRHAHVLVLIQINGGSPERIPDWHSTCFIDCRSIGNASRSPKLILSTVSAFTAWGDRLWQHLPATLYVINE